MAVVITLDNDKQTLPLESIKTLEQLQVRTPYTLNHHRESIAHIERLAKKLTGNKKQLEAIKVAKVWLPVKPVQDNEITVVLKEPVFLLMDGHHRVKAYQKAGRKNIPAQIIDFDSLKAVELWTCANANEDSNRSLNMSRAEKTNQAWRHYALDTDIGRHPLSMSVKAFNALHQLGANTVTGFKHTLKGASLHGLSDEWADSLPLWHEAKVYLADGKAGHIIENRSYLTEGDHQQKVNKKLVAMFSEEFNHIFRTHGFKREVIIAFRQVVEREAGKESGSTLNDELVSELEAIDEADQELNEWLTGERTEFDSRDF